MEVNNYQFQNTAADVDCDNCLVVTVVTAQPGKTVDAADSLIVLRWSSIDGPEVPFSECEEQVHRFSQSLPSQEFAHVVVDADKFQALTGIDE